MDIIKGKTTAFMFLKGARNDWYSTLMYDLKSQYARDVDHYLSTLNQALQLLSTHEVTSKENDDDDKTSKKKYDKQHKENTEDGKEEVAFL